jgi:hypothetical protein
LLGSEGTRTGWWALREAIAGVGAAAAAARRRCWRPNSRGGAAAREGRRARGCARVSGYYCRSAGLGSRRGVVAAFTAELGLTPWVAASAAPVIGWRERDGVHGGVCRRPRTWRPLLWATVRASHKATAGSRRRGRPRHGAERRRRHEKGAKGPALPSRLRRTRAGVHACARGPRPTRARARTLLTVNNCIKVRS